MSLNEPRTCSHCGILFRWKPVLKEDGDTPLQFCCKGCLGAYTLITSSGLDEFYSRMTVSPLPVAAPVEEFTESVPAGSIEPDGDACRIRIMIGSIRCPSCIWLLEKILCMEEGVQSVSISYTDNVASIRFDPKKGPPHRFFRTISRLGYQPRPYSPDLSDAESRRERNDLMIRMGTAFFLTMQLMAYSVALYAGYFQGISDNIKQLLQYVSLLVTAPVIFYCGMPFLKGAWNDLKNKSYGMDLLIATGSLSAFVYSIYALLTSRETYFESAAMIVTFVLTGRLLELSARRSAASGISSLLSATPRAATLKTGSILKTIDSMEVRPGDMLLVRQGERFPVDCLVIEGESDVDQSMVSGESLPVAVSAGSEVRAGSLNFSAPLVVNAVSTVGLSYVMRVAGMVQDAQSRKPKIQQIADRVAARFVPAVIAISLMTLAGKIYAGTDVMSAVMSSLSVLLIACPCSVGLAVPSAVHAACAAGIRKGVIFRGGDVFERLAVISDVIFDKTGMLTEGSPRVVSYSILNGFEHDTLLSAVAGAEVLSHHPIGAALCRFIEESGIEALEVSGFLQKPGMGISATLPGGAKMLCGNRRFMEEQGVSMPPVGESSGLTTIHVALDGRYAAVFMLDDPLRPDASRMIADIHARGLGIEILSGDDSSIVARVARECGIGSCRGNLLPEEKLDAVRKLQHSGKRVMMAGDGVNDAPAIASADVGCSISGSTELALEQSDMVVTGKNLQAIVSGFDLSRKTMAIIRQNLLWASIYNIMGIPLAVSGFLTPAFAAAAMTVSSLMVSFNSIRILRH